MDQNLPLDDGTQLPYLKKKAEYYLNKTTLLYGATDSGKSTIIDEILYLIREHIAFPFVICPTSQSSSSAYADRFPRNCIKQTMTKEWIESFAAIQKNRALIYNKANDMKNLESLFNKIPNLGRAKVIEETIKSSSRAYYRDIDNSLTLNFVQKKEQKKTVNKVMAQRLADLYKSTIRHHKYYLEKSNNLSKDEQCTLKFLDFRPHALLVLDDCASVIKKWIQTSTAIKTIFYAGRHDYITLIITTQDDKEIDSELRKNSKVSIFTTEQAAISNFTRASNSYSKHIRHRAEIVSQKIFQQTPGQDNFKKLVFLHNNSGGEPFLYTIADLYDDFTIGCPDVWKLDKMIRDRTNTNETADTDAFFDKYYNM